MRHARLLEEVEYDCFGSVLRIGLVPHGRKIDANLVCAGLAHMGYIDVFGSITPNVVDLYLRGLSQDWSLGVDSYAKDSARLFPHEVASDGAGEHDMRALAAFSLLDAKCFSWIVLSRRYGAGFKFFAGARAMYYAWKSLTGRQ